MWPVGGATILPISQKISNIEGKGGSLDYMWSGGSLECMGASRWSHYTFY